MSGEQNAIAVRDTTPLTQRDPLGLAEHFWKSGWFKDVRSLSQAVVKAAAGEELGIGPMVAMREIHIIEGAPSLSANLLGALVKRSEHYNFIPVEQAVDRIVLEFFEDGESVGTVSFTAADAQRAKAKENGQWKKLSETLRYQNWPEDMLFARCLTRGVRRFCPDVMAGSPAYTPEELGAEVDERGEPIYVESEVVAEPEAEAPILRPERVEHLVKGIALAEPSLAKNGVNALDGLNVLLGSLGIDGFAPDVELEQQLAGLTEEQADELAGELEKLVAGQDDSEGGEADAG